MKSAINLSEKFSKFSEPWSPKIIAQMNDYLTTFTTSWTVFLFRTS